MNNLVVYSNDFNFMPLPTLTELEMNLFINIICNIKENREFKCSFEDFYNKINTDNKRTYSKKETLTYFEKLAEKLLRYTIKFSVKDRFYSLFVCFERIDLIKEQNNDYTLTIKAQEDFFNLVNNKQLGFTQFELCEFMSITGKYAKSLYRLLKQFRNTGKVICFTQDWQKFCELMQIPETYKSQSDIDKIILNPAIKELSKYFKNLTFKKIKDKNSKGRGGKVIGIEFYFKTENKPIKTKEEKTTKQKSKSKECYLTQKFKNKEERKKYIEGLMQQEQQGANIGTIIVK